MFRCCISNNQYNLIFGNNFTADSVINTQTELPPSTATTLESFTVISNNHYTTTGYNKKFTTNPSDIHSETITTTSMSENGNFFQTNNDFSNFLSHGTNALCDE